MLTSDEVLNLNYYKKTSYTGWINGMRFLIRREAPEEGDAFFHAWVWPGPLIFSLTDDSLKTDFTAPFTNEGGCIRMILFVFCCIHKVLHTIDGRVNALDI